MLALDFDNAVTLRLLFFDNDKDRENKRFWVKLVTGEDIGEPDVLNSEFISDDKFADSQTEVW